MILYHNLFMVIHLYIRNLEEYYGNVNPVGPRGVYDEAKRFQEAFNYCWFLFLVDIRIAKFKYMENLNFD